MIERLVKGTARKATIPILQTVQVTRDEAKKATVLVSTDLSVPTVVTLKDETVEGLGTFPTLEKVKPKWDKKTKTLKVRLSAEVLTVLIKAVMALRSEGKATRNTSLDFEFRVPEGEKPVEDQFWVRSEYDGLKMEAIVMPMRV
jgi:hypothetical protein